MKRCLISLSLIVLVYATGFARQEPPVKNPVTQQKPPAAQTKTQTQGVPGKAEPSTRPGLPQVGENFVIGLEDVLEIRVWREPDHSAPQAVVRPDGMITLPLIGEIRAAGLTPTQLVNAIVDELKDYLTAPSVTVTVLKIESQKVMIVGQVARQGAYALGSPITVLELIARAGGLTEFAKAKDIKIIRKKDGKVLKFNYKQVMNGENLSQNVILQNGDTVVVPG